MYPLYSTCPGYSYDGFGAATPYGRAPYPPCPVYQPYCGQCERPCRRTRRCSGSIIFMILLLRLLGNNENNNNNNFQQMILIIFILLFIARNDDYDDENGIDF